MGPPDNRTIIKKKSVQKVKSPKICRQVIYIELTIWKFVLINTEYVECGFVLPLQATYVVQLVSSGHTCNMKGKRNNIVMCIIKQIAEVCWKTLLTYLLTYSMVQSPSWESNWFAVSQEIPRISRNPKVHYRTHKRPPPVSILGQPNPVHIPTSHLLEIHPNIHPSTPRSS